MNSFECRQPAPRRAHRCTLYRARGERAAHRRPRFQPFSTARGKPIPI